MINVELSLHHNLCYDDGRIDAMAALDTNNNVYNTSTAQISTHVILDARSFLLLPELQISEFIWIYIYIFINVPEINKWMNE